VLFSTYGGPGKDKACVKAWQVASLRMNAEQVRISSWPAKPPAAKRHRPRRAAQAVLQRTTGVREVSEAGDKRVAAQCRSVRVARRDKAVDQRTNRAGVLCV